MSPQTHEVADQGLVQLVTKLGGVDFTMYTAFPKQADFHRNQISKLIAIGNRGGGKSVMLRFDAHLRALSHPGANLALVRKTYKDLMKNHVFFQATKAMPWGSLKKEMELLGGTFNKTDYICHYPNGSKLFLSYVGDESDTMNLLGAEFLAAYFDELSTIPWDYFTKLVSSVRVSTDSGWNPVIRAATNPLGESTAEIYKYFVNHEVEWEENQDYNPREWGHIKINMEDNAHIDSVQYKKDLLSLNLPEHVKKAWIEGEYFEETALFSFYPMREGQPYHVIREIDLQSILNGARIYRAYDHGYKPDPAYCLWIAHLGDRYLAFHEKAWYEMSVPEIAESIKQEERDLGITRVSDSFCDPTIHIKTGQPRTIKELFEDYGIYFEPSTNDRRQYAAMVHAALAEEAGPSMPRLQIFANGRQGCPYLVKAIPLQRYDPKRPMFMADNKHDHPVVALSYFLTNFAADEHRHPAVAKKPHKWQRHNPDDRWVLGRYNTRNRA